MLSNRRKFAAAFILMFFVSIFPFIARGQNPLGHYNPFVSSGAITPAPIWPVEANGTGVLSFTVGNSGRDPLDVYVNNQVILTITLSNGVPDNTDPLQAVGGSFVNLFSWSYSLGTYTGTQINSIPAKLSGTITIAYKVTQNSLKSNPQNGFNVTLTPAPYQTTSNSTSDDTLSKYTWTEVHDFGDAPASYGSADHIIDFQNMLGVTIDGETANQPSLHADGDDTHGIDDEEGVVFPTMIAGTTVSIQITVTGSGYLNAWIDWSGNGSFSAGDRIANNISVSNQVYNLSVTIPADAVVTAPTFARFRLGPRSTNKPTYGATGTADFGEVEDYEIQILCAPPAAPGIGSITQPTCSLATGSVDLNGLPTPGTWTLTVMPSGRIINGSGANYTVTSLNEGTYTFTVTNSSGCSSGSSSNAIINAQPVSPASPVQTIDCTQGFNHAVITVTSPVGTDLLYSLDGGTLQQSVNFSGVANGSHNITVQNSVGCSTTGPAFQVSCSCVNPPLLTLSSLNGSVCGITTPVTIQGNTFGGSATVVTITENGAGSVNPSSASTSPFTFTYNPAAGDANKTVNITITTNNPLGAPCQAKIAVFNLTVNGIPAAPGVGTITQPTCQVPGGSVTLSGLPATGTWTLVRNPGAIITTGTGSITKITGLDPATYNFTVSIVSGCTSAASADVVIVPAPDAPKVLIKDPAPVCFPGKADLTASSVTEGSTTGLTFTYWSDRAGAVAYTTPDAATAGTYYIKGTNANMCYDIEPVTVTVLQKPLVNAGPDQNLKYLFTADLNANVPGVNESGHWKVLTGSGKIVDTASATTSVKDLSAGKNILLWTITNKVCPPSSDSLTIIVQDIIIPTLITPNNDGRNDYFVIDGLELQGKTELMIFDRYGSRLFLNDNYDNKWNGVDYNGNPLPDDTYFYVLKSGNGRSHTGFIVLRH